MGFLYERSVAKVLKRLFFLLAVVFCHSAQASEIDYNVEMAWGDSVAPVTVTQYSVYWCGACTWWHLEQFSDFQEQYIATKKVRFVRRHLTHGYEGEKLASLIGRCGGGDFHRDMAHEFYEKYAEWGRSSDRLSALIDLAIKNGLSKERIDVCLENQELKDFVHREFSLFQRQEWLKEHEVNAYPTFYIENEEGESFMVVGGDTKKIIEIIEKFLNVEEDTD